MHYKQIISLNLPAISETEVIIPIAQEGSRAVQGSGPVRTGVAEAQLQSDSVCLGMLHSAHHVKGTQRETNIHFMFSAIYSSFCIFQNVGSLITLPLLAAS